MKLRLLDTDTFSLYGRGHPQVVARFEALLMSEVAVSIITVEEQILGWHDLARRAKRPQDVAEAYRLMTETVTRLVRVPVLPFTEAAVRRFEALRAAKLNVGSQDLRIAGIALEYDVVVVTRNRRDFERVPGLDCEDWTEPR